ncbi:MULTISPECIES: M15 family metallopeptidase [unclassified Saccharopolyspora]|uniref:M15 family metallopeptidase n=1 Tax=unclassified Saccharopolyspora TaxID=2646250 RepID=UPI001CD49335|nr:MULTISPECIES: M15 family metallopeptidase [unclassified Saccharopolyspora]MCA1187040.1 M15 family metallopeptidase [Saccharopolyspora sp. 6T]MCA1191906.1 M15 family metallopeptidase [Saccharopolyspora sp. 6V]MCA1224829.1 M15 family metallopeptidase [Saccharopolyspora sp. 6M]MCA1280177.1 M15 family metallopeptidase [Saccharopolyspora sp. 7B]
MRNSRGSSSRRLTAAFACALVATTVQCGNPQPPAGEPAPRFTSSVEPVDAARLGASWHPGCPVAPDRLRLLRLSHVGVDGQERTGELVVHEDRVRQTVDAFARLHALRFPIERMRPAGDYPGAEDETSMRANNTSAFNCRGISGSGSWSQHAYGRAVDVNPLRNPYLSSEGDLQPATAGPYLDRTRRDPGMLHDGDAAVRMFTDAGWTWGGSWHDPKDYQHFELP